ncbi:glycoside hydrolase family 127 protein [Paenibacillus methanolicus]|uniref:DUF1680 family protein n=1 Tax=Paenibacillus methanolicus TaxID=582686 RepID=A0A5S5CMN3_9BACL|nr:glycoside hydrolase family 127 protein [Paenibacillus methanolicus]TYP79638.1 hypothetical protein BCM02_101759 [Paenibacillus methanolicus]
MQLNAFDLKQVRIDGGPLKNAMDLNRDYLLKLDADRLLSRFREFAGLEPKAPRYEGWESRGISGHTLGHYLSGCSLMYAATGDPALKERAAYVVDELALCQEAHGDGYVSGIPRGKELFQEIKAGDIRSQGFDLNGGWVPLYTMHKLYAGLRDAYRYASNERALEVEIKLGLWLEDILAELSEAQVQQVLHCEFGGMNEALADLAADTGDARFLRLAERFYHGEVLNDLAEERDTLGGRHANTQIPKIIGAARQYEVSGKPHYAGIARYFWDRVVHHHSYVIGGNSYNEHFGDPGMLNDRLGEGTCETCNTYNMLKLTRHLIRWDGVAEYADYYERAMFNHVLASQQPVDGRVCYFVSLEMGGHKTFNSQFEDFTCCVGSGMESHSLYGAGLYFKSEDALVVNQFVPSSVQWAERGVTLSQETDFPTTGSGRLVVRSDGDAAPGSFTLYIRYPHWAQNGMQIRVNGEAWPIGEAVPSSYVSIAREWTDGDTVEYVMPFSVRVETMPDNPNRIAFLYGPLVLAGDLGEIADNRSDDAEWPLASVLIGRRAELTSALSPDPDHPGALRLTGVAYRGDLTLRPFYQLYDRAYTVYWDFFTPEGWRGEEAAYRESIEAQQRLERQTVDAVQPAEMQPERDHAFEGEHVGLGKMYNRKYRDTWPSGWFAFTMRVLPDEPVRLAVTYIRSSDEKLGFDVLAGGEALADGRVESEEMNKFVTYVYDIPLDVTAGQDSIPVAFRAHPGRKVAPVAGIRIVRMP